MADKVARKHAMLEDAQRDLTMKDMENALNKARSELRTARQKLAELKKQGEKGEVDRRLLYKRDHDVKKVEMEARLIGLIRFWMSERGIKQLEGLVT